MEGSSEEASKAGQETTAAPPPSAKSPYVLSGDIFLAFPFRVRIIADQRNSRVTTGERVGNYESFGTARSLRLVLRILNRFFFSPRC